MSRYIFTPQGIASLKKTVHQTVNVIDNFYWISRFIGISAINNQLPTEQEVEAIFLDAGGLRFKPKTSWLLNAISKIFGYRDFTEMSTVSKSQSPSCSIVVGESDYAQPLSDLFYRLMVDHFDLSNSVQPSAKIITTLTVNAWELNKSLVPHKAIKIELASGRNKGMFKDVSVSLEDGLWTFSNSLMGNIGAYEDKSYQGHLLPLLGYYELGMPAVASDMEQIHRLHLAIGDDQDRIKANGGAVLAFARLQTDGTSVYLLPHHHSIYEVLMSSDKQLLKEMLLLTQNDHAACLLAYLSQFQPIHRSTHEMAEWFLNPHTLEDRKAMFKMEKVSESYLSEGGVYQYRKAR